MIRIVAVLLAVLLTGALGGGGALAQMPKSESAQPKSMDQPKSMEMNKRVEGTIKSVQGSIVTLDDGTTLSIPSSVKVSRDQLKPGAMIVAEYEERGGQKVATSVQIKG